MGKPITTKSGGICFAFPNVCLTQVGPATVPIPYPSIGQLSDASGTASNVKAGGAEVVTQASTIASTKGDSAGVSGVTSGTVGGPVEFKTFSSSVFAGGKAVVRMFDQTLQNNKNCVGVVLGGKPSVLVGG
jgi:hypothetical protein